MAGRPRGFDEQEVATKAMRVFWSQGYRGTGIRELVSETGVGRQSLYNCFGDKAGLFGKALEAYVDERFGPALELLTGDGSPLANVRALMEMEAERALDPDGCFVANTIAEMGPGVEEVSEQLSGCVKGLEDTLTRALRKAQEIGELSEEQDPRSLARTLIAGLMGLALLARIGLSKAHVRAVSKTLLTLLD